MLIYILSYFSQEKKYERNVASINEKAKGKSDTFDELEKGYSFKTPWREDEYGLYKRVDEAQTTYVDMSKPIPCSYNRFDEEAKKNVPIALNQVSLGRPSSPSPVEHRAITLRQLRAVLANIERRCVAEGWVNFKNEKLSPDTVTLYDANAYVILPYTKDKALSFVACLPSTAGPQPPRFFASHWWGEPVKDFLRCIEQFVRDFGVNGYRWHGGFGVEDDIRGGGMTADTPIWVCAYANNQHDLSSDITVDPKQSGFTRAMEAAEGRTITILDTGGVVFSRVWCAFELYLTLVDKRVKDGGKSKGGVWAVYTAHTHTGGWREEEREAVGIISGGAPSDQGHDRRTVLREQHFPFKLIKQSLTIKVETAKASEEEDRIHILNSIIGNDGDGLDDTPPLSDTKYDEVNEAVQAGFISTIGSLKGAAKENDDVWNNFLIALSKGKKQLNLEFIFDEDGWEGLWAERAAQMMRHLPPTIMRLGIYRPDFGADFVDAMSEHIRQSSQLDYLWLSGVKAGGDEEGKKAAVRFAEAVGDNKSLTTLQLIEGTAVIGLENLEQWGFALTKNNTLTELVLRGVDDKDEIISKLKELTKDRTPYLNIRL